MNFLINERVSLYLQLIRYQGLQVHQKRLAITLYLNLITFMLSAHLTKTIKQSCYLSFKSAIADYPHQQLPVGHVERWLKPAEPDELLTAGMSDLLAYEAILYQDFFVSGYLRLPSEAYTLIDAFIDRMTKNRADSEATAAMQHDIIQCLTRRSNTLINMGLANGVPQDVSEEATDSEEGLVARSTESFGLQKTEADASARNAKQRGETEACSEVLIESNFESFVLHETAPVITPIEEHIVSPAESFAIVRGSQLWSTLGSAFCWRQLLSVARFISITTYSADHCNCLILTQQDHADDLPVLHGMQYLLGDRLLQDIFHCVNIAPSLAAEHSMLLTDSAEELRWDFEPKPEVTLQRHYQEAVPSSLLRVRYRASTQQLDGNEETYFTFNFEWKSEQIQLISVSLPSLPVEALPVIKIAENAWTRQLQPTVSSLYAYSAEDLQEAYIDERGLQDIWLPKGITLFGWSSHASQVLQATSAREVRSLFWRHYNRAGISQFILNRLLNNDPLFTLTDDEPLGHSHE